jgi:hypothetical protein
MNGPVSRTSHFKSKVAVFVNAFFARNLVAKALAAIKMLSVSCNVALYKEKC